ncbi:MAG TPA: protein kinase [Gaiellaceae bacterium]|nr:protein kinase [Gaiellaceae bacterium]
MCQSGAALCAESHSNCVSRLRRAPSGVAVTTELRRHLRATLGAGYTLEHELNGGGMSRVFVAEEISLGRKVVVKVISPALASAISIGRFQREIAMAAHVQHPHVVPVLTAGQLENGLPFYTMPYIEGASLRARLDAGPLALPEAVSILRDVCKALAYAHRHGVVHRDIKPENVLLTGGSAVVTDFGIAKALDGAAIDNCAADVAITLSHLGIPVGSPSYMAPEQICGDPAIDNRADLYSLGVVAYEMLGGRHPFDGLRSYELLAAHISATPEPLELLCPDAPLSLAALVAHLMQKRPADRPTDAAEVLARLDAIGSRIGGGRRQSRASVERVVDASRRRGRRVAAAVAIGACLSLAYDAPAPDASSSDVGDGLVTTDVGAGGIRSLAILPFVNVGGDSRDDYFSSGMTDELLTTLGKIPGLRVAGRGPAFAFGGDRFDARAVGKELHVAAVLEGSVRRVGPALHVTAQLVKVSDGLPIWSKTYERQMKDVFQLREELARAIAGALRMQLDVADDAPLVRRPTRDLEAYDLYLKGRYVWNQRTAVSLAQAARYFEAAVARDPSFAEAHAGLADTYVLLPRYGGVAPAVAWTRARTSAERALVLDSSRGEAHAALAFGRMIYERDGAGAEREFARALALDPNYATGHQWYGDYLIGRGRAEEGSRELRRAQELDPLSPVIGSELGWSLYILRRYDEAVTQLRQTLELNPDFALAHLWLGMSLLGKGMQADAIRELRRGVDLGGRNPEDVATLGYAHAVAGDRRAARRRLTELEDRSRQEFVAPSTFGIIYVGLGDKTRAFAWLNRAVDERDTRLVDLLMDPRFDALRSDPRFARLTQRVGR